MNRTRPKNNPPPVRGGRRVLKCRCGGLYIDADAHHNAFGHRPEPVTA